MKILHLNTFDAGGAATAVYRFHQSLIKRGHQSVMLVREKTKEDSSIQKFRIRNLWWFARYKLHKAENLVMRTDPKYHFYNWNERFHFPTKHFLDQLPFQPDLICVHWISGFVNTKNIQELSKLTSAPVIWRFNDMSAFTGGCHYSNGCDGYTRECGKCPALYSKDGTDRSNKNLLEKKKWISATNLTYISSTTEIDEQLAGSSLAAVSKKRKILIGSGSEFFYLRPAKEPAREELGLDINKKIIYFGAVNIDDKRKGVEQLLQSLKILKKNITADLANQVLVVFSSREGELSIEIPFQTQRISFLKGDEALSKMYNAATIFVSPSIEDAGPIMLVESMLCGTPTIAFEVGLAKDTVINNVTGFIAPPMDVDKFAMAMKTVLEMQDEDYTALSARCALKARELFSEEREMDEYEQLFNELTQRDHV